MKTYLHLLRPPLHNNGIVRRRVIIASVAVAAGVAFSACDKHDKQETGANSSPSMTVVTQDVDNTAKNVRDRKEEALTPGDQGESPSDREITRKIRKSLVTESSGYSTTAKNVKIITVNGKVTLRGPVNTQAEKLGIATLAKAVAGEGNVDDQLEVKANP